MATLNGNEVLTSKKYTQVYQATHAGEEILPYMRRSFISFTFGGKRIEDFNLIATFDGDRMSRPAYAPFEDTVTTYSNLNGQYYWSTHQQPNILELNLSTDGIDQKQLDDFLYWFQPGLTKELILAEHPNRAILARVSEPPQLNLLPFEGAITMQFASQTYQTSTTLYKGDIQLSFVMDQPYWYAKTNLLGIFTTTNGTKHYINEWIDAAGNQVPIFGSPDALKIIYEDGIPVGSMISNDMLLGNGQYAVIDDKVYARIWNPNYIDSVIPNKYNLEGGGACIAGTVNGITYIGQIAGAVISESGTLILPSARNGINSSNVGYFYYAGTAPACTELSFTTTLHSNNYGYINTFGNSYSTVIENTPYSTITVESVDTQELRLTTPNLYTSFNRVIFLFRAYVKSTSVKSWSDIRQLIREDVKHQDVRAYANYVLDNLDSSALPTTEGVLDTLTTAMWNFFKDDEGVLQPAHFVFNSETGSALGTFAYRQKSGQEYVLSTNIVEDVGDMLCSNYLVIRERNYPSENNAFVSWENTAEGKKHSHRIYHNLPVSLSEVSIIYKNMYL